MEPYYHEMAANLELWNGLLCFPSALTLEEWTRFLSILDPRYRRVVILHVIWEMTMPEIGERLGFSRGRADQMWRKSLELLARRRIGFLEPPVRQRA